MVLLGRPVRRRGAIVATVGLCAASVCLRSHWSRCSLQDAAFVTGPAAATVVQRAVAAKTSQRGMPNLFDFIEEAQGMPTPEQPELPLLPPGIQPLLPMASSVTGFTLQEKLSLSGQDFEILGPNGQVMFRVNGGNRLPIPGAPKWDKMEFVADNGQMVSRLEREILALTATYSIYRPDGSKYGKVNKAMALWGTTFEMFIEGDENPWPALKADLSGSDRKCFYKDRKGKTIAATGRGFFQDDRMNSYQVVIGPQVDQGGVLAMAAIIDEIHDEEDERKKPEEQKDGGFSLPFR